MDVGFKTVGYLASWSFYSNNYAPENIPIENLTHLVYAFANLRDNHITLGDPWMDVDKEFSKSSKGLIGYINDSDGALRKRNPDFKSIISIGGWTYSKEFSVMARAKESRDKFTDSVIEFIDNYGFDGVDIDWEYPVTGGEAGNTRDSNDGENFVSLLTDLRSALDKHGESKRSGKYYELGIAVSPNPEVAKYVNFTQVSEQVDFINVMGYDFSGSWSKKVEHNSNVLAYNSDTEFSAKKAIKFYLDQGVDKSKLLLGAAFYGKIFRGVDQEKYDGVTGVNQISKGVSYNSEIDGVKESGVMFYKDIKKYTIPGNFGNFFAYFDNNRGTPYLYSKSKKLWITYENQKSLMYKCALINELNLGGFMVWEVSQDYNHELMSVITKCKDFKGC